MVHIFYHHDADGFAAAAVIGQTFLELTEEGFQYKEPVSYHICDHSKPLDFAEVNPDGSDQLYFVDYSFSRVDDQLLLEKYLQDHPGCHFCWIDHHQTSNLIIHDHPVFAEKLKEDGLVLIPGDLEARYKEEKNDDVYSGAMLAYFYLIGSKDELYRRDESPVFTKDLVCLKALYEGAPAWIRLVSDHDTWRHDLEGSEEFTKGCTHKGLYATFLEHNRDTDPSYIEIMYSYMQAMYGRNTLIYSEYNLKGANKTKDLIETGKNLFAIEDSRSCRLLKSNGFEAAISIRVSPETVDKDGVLGFPVDEDGMIYETARVICFNGYGNSRVFLNAYDLYDAVVIFSFDGEFYKYSMYSKADGGFRCNLAALCFNKIYGITGGGHAHAAGWTISAKDVPTFLKNQLTVIDDNGLTYLPFTCKSEWENGRRDEITVNR
jgi:hypothetical protein